MAATADGPPRKKKPCYDAAFKLKVVAYAESATSLLTRRLYVNGGKGRPACSCSQTKRKGHMEEVEKAAYPDEEQVLFFWISDLRASIL